MLDLIFVYGTLRSTSSAPMAGELARNATLLGPARVRGRIVDLGAYPALLEPASPDDWVDGEIWRVHTPQEFLRVLDDYEGCGANDPEPQEYKRVVCDGLLESGETVEAWVYLYMLQR